ncbi:MAG: hypothetical protein RIS54_1044 [Verrucomicrobiota bacterium]|jgi:hypothetical protein
MDPAYPNMPRWAVAGIRQVPGNDLPVIALAPGDDLAAAVVVPGRIVQLAPGDYPIDATLRFADRVILRGAGTNRTRLVINLRGTRPTEPDYKFFLP